MNLDPNRKTIIQLGEDHDDEVYGNRNDFLEEYTEADLAQLKNDFRTDILYGPKPKTAEELFDCIHALFGLEVPYTTVIGGEHNMSPLEWMWKIFSGQWELSLAWGAREGGKTLGFSLIECLLGIYEPGNDIIHAGGVTRQADVAMTYMEEWSKDPVLGKILKKDSARKTEFRNGSKMRIVPGKYSSIDGQHPNTLAADEIKHWDVKSLNQALALDTPVPTPGGWTTMGEIQVGDKVFDENGGICTVTQAHPVQYGSKCYDVVFEDGSRIVADAEHLWLTHDALYRQFLRNSAHSRRKAQAEGRCVNPKLRRGVKGFPKILTTKDIKATLFSDTVRSVKYNHYVPLAKALKLADALLPLDPYVLGMWLGDGCTNAAQFTTKDEELVESLRSAGFAPNKIKHCQYYVPGLKKHLRDAGVATEKHVPTIYKRASASQRLRVVQGLMDTDGCAMHCGTCVFTNTNKTLVEDLAELVHSLGMRSSIVKEIRATGGGVVPVGNYKTQYKLTFTPNEQVFALSRKAKHVRLAENRPKSNARRIVSVEEVDSVPVRCIAVDSPSHLFLVGRSMIPTHNCWKVPSERNGIPKRYMLGSTNQEAGGGFNFILDEAQNRGIGIARWSIMETMQPCVSCRALDEHPHGTDEAREQTCALWSYCRGVNAKQATGWLPLDRVLSDVKQLGGPQTPEARTQLFCLEPSTKGLCVFNFVHKPRNQGGNYTDLKYTPELPFFVHFDPSEGAKSAMGFWHYYWHAESGNGYCFMFDELVIDDCPDDTVAKLALYEYLKRKGYPDPVRIIVDPHRTDAIHRLRQGTYDGEGLNHKFRAVAPPIKEKDGGETIAVWMNEYRQEVCEGGENGVRRMLVNPETCPRHVHAIKNWFYSTDPMTGDVKASSKPKEAFKDENDGIRYWLRYKRRKLDKRGGMIDFLEI